MIRNRKFMEIPSRERGEASLRMIGIHWVATLPRLKGKSKRDKIGLYFPNYQWN